MDLFAKRALLPVLFFLSACVGSSKSSAPEVPAPVRAEQQLGDAEHKIAAHDVDAAETILGEAKTTIARAKTAPEHAALTKRYEQLSSRLDAMKEAKRQKAIADAKERLDEARRAAEAKTAAVGGDDADAAAFEAARADTQKLEALLDEQKGFESDEGYAAAVAESKTVLAASEKTIDERWGAVGADIQKKQLAEKSAALDASLTTAKRGTNDDVAAAKTAIGAVEATLENGKPFEKDKVYARSVADANKKIEGAKKLLEARTAELAIAAHHEAVEEAKNAAMAAVDALPTNESEDRFEAASKLVAAVEAKLAEGAAFEEDKGHQRFVAAVTKDVAAQKKAIEDAKGQAAVAEHRREVEAASADVEAKLAALEGTTEAAPFAAAGASIDALEKTIAKGEALAKGDRQHAAFLAAATKAVPRHRAAVAGQDGARKVTLHRAELTAAKTKVDEALAALEGSLEHKRYQTAEDAVSALKKTVDGGEEVAAEDKAYARELSAARAGLDGQRATIRTARVAAAQAAADEKLSALEGAPSGAAFAAAEDALRTVESTIEAAKRFETSDRAYGRTIAAAESKLAADRVGVERRKVEVEVAADATGVDAAAEKLTAKMAALDGEPDDAAFTAASAAAAALKNEIESGEAVAEKDKAYAAKLAGLAKQAAAHEATIARRRHEVDVAKHRAKVEAKTAEVVTSLEGLAGAPADAAFSKASAAVDALEASLEAGQPVAEGDKKYTVELAVIGKKVAPYRAQIEARRLEVDVAAHEAKVEAATAAMTEKLAALDEEPKEADFAAAESAVAAYRSTVEAGASLGERDKGYARTLAALTKKVPAYEAQIARRQQETMVAAHRKRIDSVASAVEAQVAAMNEAPSSETIVAATKAVRGLEQALGAEDELLKTDKKHAAYVAGLKRVVPQHLAAIEKQKIAKEVADHRVELDAAKKVLDEKLAALEGKLDQPLYQSAENAVSGLRRAIASGADAAAKDSGYAKVLAAEERGIDGHRLTIKRRWVEAASAAANTAVEALAEAPKSGDFRNAEDAVATLASTTEAAERMETKDRDYARFVAGAKKEHAALEKKIATRRVEVKVAAHRAKVDAAVAKVDERIGALSGEPNDSAFAAATEAVADLTSEIDAGEEAANDDKAHRAYLAALSKKAADYGTTIEGRRTEVDVEAHRAKVAARQAKVDERMAALSEAPKPADFDAALEAVDSLGASLDDGAAVAERDKKYAAELASAKKTLDPYRSKVERRRVEVQVAAHRASVEAAQAAMDEKIGALGEAPAFDDASAAVDAFEAALADGADAAAKDKGYAKELAALGKKVAPARRTIDSQRTAAAVAAHRAKIDTTNEAVTERFGALDEGGSIIEAERAVAGLQRVVEAEGELVGKDKKHAAYVAGMKKTVAAYRQKIERAKIAKAVAEHRGELEAAKTAVDEKLAALEGSLEHARYQAAEDAVGALKRTIEGGQSAAEKDKGYARALAAEASRLPAMKLTIRQRRVEAASGALATKVDGLSGEDADFSGAEDALRTLESTIEAAQMKETKDRDYLKFLAASERTAKAQRAAIDRKKVDVEVAAHRQKVDAALATVDERMKALEGEPNAGAFDSARSAVDRMADDVGSGEAVATKDKKYRGYLASLTKRADGLRAAIAKRRVEVDVAKHQKRVEADTMTVTSRIEGLADEPKSSDFTAALDAVDTLEASLKDGADVADKDKGYAKALAAQTKKLPAYRSQIARRRVEVDVAAHAARVDAAATAAEQAVGGLDDEANGTAIDGADEAVTALEQAIAAGDEVAAKDKKHAGYLAAQSKRAAGYRRGLDRQRVTLEVRGQAAKVDAARAAVDERLGALVGSLEHQRYQAAEDAVSALKRALDASDEVASKDRAFAKRVGSELAQIEGHRRTIRLRRVESAQSALDEKMASLEGDSPDFDAAEEGVRDLESTIEAARRKETKDKSYQKALAAADRVVKARRGAIDEAKLDLEVAAHRKKVDAAVAAADERMGALDGAPEDGAFDAAGSSLERLQNQLDDGEAVASRSKAYRGYLASLSKKVAADRKRIERRKVEVAVAAHRAKVEAGTAAVAERIDALSEEPKEADFAAAVDRIDELEQIIADGGAVSDEDKGYGKELAKAASGLKGYRSKIARRKIEVAVAAQRAQVAAAAESVDESLAALKDAEDAAPIEKADTSVAKLEDALGSVNGLAEKDRTFGKYIAAMSKKARSSRARIERARVDVQVQKQANELEAASTAVQERLGALEGSLEHERYQAAEVAISQLKKVIESSEEIADKDKSFKKQLVVARRGLDTKRRLIRRRRVEAATAQMNERMAALDEEPKADDFSAALEAARVLENTTEAARTFKTEDKKYVQYLAAIEKKNADYKEAIEQRRVELAAEKHQVGVDEALAAANEKVGALDGSPEASQFGEASDAVRQLKDRIADGEGVAAKSGRYRKYLAGLSKQAAGFDKRIEARRIGVEVDRHRTELDAAVTQVDERIDALGVDAEPAAYSAAIDAVDDLEKVIDGGADAGDKSKKYAKRLAVEQKKLAKHRSRIARRKTAAELAASEAKFAAAETALDEAMGALSADAEDDAFSTANEAIEQYAAAIDEVTPYAAKDKKLKRRLAKAKKRVPGSKKTIARVRLSQELRAHAAKLEAASNRVEERVGQLEGGDVAVQDAERAVTELEEAIAAGAELTKRSKAHRKTVAAYQRRIPKYRGTIGQQKVAGQVAEHRAELEQASQAASNALEAIEGKMDYELYRDAESAVSSLKKTAEGGMELGAEDRRYGKELDAVLTRVPAYQWQIRKTWIEAADGVVKARMAAVPDQPGDGDFAEVEEAIGTLENTTESGNKFADDSKKYRKYLAVSMKNVGRYRSRLRRMRLEGELSGVRAELVAADKSAAEAMAALEEAPDEDRLDAAESAVRDAKRQADSADTYAKRDKAFKKQRAAMMRRLAKSEKRIERLRVAAMVAPHEKAIAEASAAVEERLEALAGEPDDAAFAAAMDAVDEYAATVDRGLGAAEKSKKFDRVLKKKAKLTGRYRKRIERARARGEIAGHREELVAARSALDEKVAALDGDDVSKDASEAARDAADTLEGVVRSGERLGRADKAYRKELRAAARHAKDQRVEVAKRAVSVQAEAVEAQIANLSGMEPEPYGDAREAVEALEKQLHEAWPAAKKDKKLRRYLARQTKALKKHRRVIATKQKNAVLEVHRSQVEAAASSMRESVANLGEESAAGEFEVAKGAIDDVLTVVDRGAPLAKKSKGYKKYLAKVRREAKKQRSVIARRRLAPELAAHRQRVEEAQNTVLTRLDEMSGEATANDFVTALEAVEELEAAIADGSSLAKQSKKHKKFLAASRRVSKKYKARIRRDRAEVELLPHKKRLAAALDALQSRMADLKTATELSSFEAAAEAADDLEGVLRDGRSLAKGKKRYQKELRAAAKRMKRARSTIRRKSLDIEKQRVAVAWRAFSPHVRTAKKKPAKLDFDAAMESAERVEDALTAGRDSKNRSYKKYARSIAKKLKIGKRKIEASKLKRDLRVQTRSLKRAVKQLTKRSKKLKRRPDEADFEAVDEALSTLERVLEDGAALEDASKKYKKLAKRSKRSLEKGRKRFERARARNSNS